MVEIGYARYHCPNCEAELEQEGYLIVEAEDEAPARQILEGTANMVECSQCGNVMRLNMPLLYHDPEQELLIIYVPGLAEMEQIDLADYVRYPYGLLATRYAERQGIELPEPDEAAFPRGEEGEAVKQPGAKFNALTQEQAEQFFPTYILRPTIVDNFDVLRTAAQAAFEGMSGQELNEDMARLQLINQLIAAPDPIARRKVLTHSGPYLNAELFVVIDTLIEQMQEEAQPELLEKLHWVRGEVQRYQETQQKRLKDNKAKRAAKASPAEQPES
jgi:hypothetical protein